MAPADTWILAALVLAVALLYSSVGHGGASGYLAVMALLGVAPAVLRPTALALPDFLYKRVVGAVLLVAALHLLRTAARAHHPGVRPPPWWVALGVGAGLGLLSGLTGVGGGIFLSPLLLAVGWAGARETAAVSAAFILVNSLAGLAGFASVRGELPGAEIAILGLAAGTGGFAGSRLGSRRLSRPTIRRLLAVVLVLAGVKFLLLL